MSKPCYYCSGQHYEAAGLEACLRDALKREDLAYKCLARSYEELMKIHDREHAMIERLVCVMKSPKAGLYSESLREQIMAAEELLDRHLKAGQPKEGA